MSTHAEVLAKVKKMKESNPDTDLPDNLVVSRSDAMWLESDVTGNPSRIGMAHTCAARSMALAYQEIPAHEATDLQRHAHESIHYVVEGSGYSEIGERRVTWGKDDLVYTPPWAWHRHYNDSDVQVRMLIIENSALLDFLGVGRRESAGLVTWDEFKQSQ